MGMATVGNMMAQVVKAKVKKSDPVSKVMYKQFKMVSVCICLNLNPANIFVCLLLFF